MQQNTIRTADKPLGKPWRSGLALPARIDNRLRTFSRFAMNSKGDALLVWLESKDNISKQPARMRYIKRQSGNSWSTPQIAFTTDKIGALDDVIMGENGDALVVWQTADKRFCVGRSCMPTDFRLYASRLPNGQVSWNTQLVADLPQTYKYKTSAALDGKGRGIIIYQGDIYPTFAKVLAVTQLSPLQSWGTPTHLADISYFHKVYVDNAGIMTLIGSVTPTINPNSLFALNGNIATNKWGMPALIASGYDNIPLMAFAKNGAALLVWKNTVDSRIRAVIRPNSKSAWSLPTTVAESPTFKINNYFYFTGLDLNGHGQAVVTYQLGFLHQDAFAVNFQ